jgi:hypothetical protein
MPRFYFHLQDRDSRVCDEIGLALPDAEAAWYQAVRSARDLIGAGLHLGCSWAGQSVEIEDEQGAPVWRVPLEEVVQYTL